MAKTETNVTNFKVNQSDYNTILTNLSSIGENELIITTDINLPIPTTNDNGKLVGISSTGAYELKTPLTSISSSSTNNEVVGAKCIYDLIGDLESLLEALL